MNNLPIENPEAFYHQKIQELDQNLARSKRQRNLVSIALIAVFFLMAWCIYRFFTNPSSAIFIASSLVTMAGFIVLSRIDSVFLAKIDSWKALLEFNQNELNYLKGDVSALDPGNEFKDPNHAYSNDLDVFGEESIFQVINRSMTANGKMAVANMLLQPCLNETEIKSRQEATRELIGKVDWYQRFLTSGKHRKISKTSEQMIEHWKKLNYFFASKKTKYLIYSSNIVLLILMVLAFFHVRFIGLSVVWFLVQLMVAFRYSSKIAKLTDELGTFITAVGNYSFLAKVMREESFTSPLLVQLEQELFAGRNALKAFSSLNKIQNGFEARANVLITVLLDGLYLNDLRLILRLDRWKKEHLDDIDRWIATINQMEVLASMANYRFNHPTYAIPSPYGESLLDAKALGHPLIPSKQMVTNDFCTSKLHELYIVTGANMAGKSTFLRSVGVNFLLALSGNVVCAESLSFKPVQLFTSMRTTDNLTKGTSYFHAELLRLKALVEKVADNQPHFIILDEMLKGTNSLDKLNGSIKFLNRLLQLPVSGLVATHDLALGNLAEDKPQHFYTICFEIEHTDSDIIYDYKLKKGVSQNMNASILMQQMGLI